MILGTKISLTDTEGKLKKKENFLYLIYVLSSTLTVVFATLPQTWSTCLKRPKSLSIKNQNFIHPDCLNFQSQFLSHFRITADCNFTFLCENWNYWFLTFSSFKNFIFILNVLMAMFIKHVIQNLKKIPLFSLSFK